VLRGRESPWRAARMASCCMARATAAAHCRGMASPDNPAVAFAATMADDRPAPRIQGCRP